MAERRKSCTSMRSCLLEVAERCSEWTEQTQPTVRQERRALRLFTTTAVARSNIFSKDIDLTTFAYNGHGDVITNISESSHTEYAFGEEGTLTPKPDSTRSHRSGTQFRYQYDPHGNWIEKIAETPGGPIWSLER